MPKLVRVSTRPTAIAARIRTRNGTGTAQRTPLPSHWNDLGRPETTVPRVSQIEMPSISDLVPSVTRIGCTPMVATRKPVSSPISVHSRSPASSATATIAVVSMLPAPAGSQVDMIHAISSAHWLVVAMMARLSPPEISGMTMASARSPSSGSWNIIDCTVPKLSNRPGSSSVNSTTKAASRPNSPAALPGPAPRVSRVSRFGAAAVAGALMPRPPCGRAVGPAWTGR